MRLREIPSRVLRLLKSLELPKLTETEAWLLLFLEEEEAAL